MKKLLFLITFLPLFSAAQTRALTSAGVKSITTTGTSITNAVTPINIVTDVIKANTLSTYKKVAFSSVLNVTSLLVAPSVNIKVTFGSTTVNVAAALPLSISLTAAPIIVEGYIKNKGATNSQIIVILIKQGPTLALTIGGNAGIYTGTMAIDTTADNTLTVSANFSTAVAGSTLTLVDAEMVRDL